MNGFYKKNGLVFGMVLGMLLLNGSLDAITINNQPLESIINPGEVVSFTFEVNEVVSIEIEKDNFRVYSGDINSAGNLTEVFEEVVQSSFCDLTSKQSLNIYCSKFGRNLSHMIAHKSLNLTVNKYLDMIQCLLESPSITITGNKIKLQCCFLVDTRILNIAIKGAEWDCVVGLEFYNQAENPTFLDARIDLKNNEAKNSLVITNVKEMTFDFLFHDAAMKNKKRIIGKIFQAIAGFMRST